MRGLCSLTLLRPGSKEPIGERWAPAQHQRTSAQSLFLALGAQPDANLAIVCGEISNIVIVDLDSSDAVTWAKENLPNTPMKTRTARGEHWFYRWPGPVPNRRRLRGVDADVKADGGYVVAPGSRHPSGVIYEALGAWTREVLATIPLFERSWLEDVTEDELFGFNALRALRAALKTSPAAMRAIVDAANKRR